MSVNFNKPHAVDVPVVDLDDPEDDVLFAQSQNRRNSQGLFDYQNASNHGEYGDYGDSNSGGFFTKVANFLRSGRRSASYELMEDNQDVEFFNVDDDDENSDDVDASANLRKYSIKRLERKLNKTILCFACGLVFVFAFLFLQKDRLAVYGDSPVQKILLSNTTHNFHPTTLMISLDGFHPHYISRENTPALHKMLVDQYGAPYMTPSFPSSTFPNHWTLVTGLYPADHGIVGNTFYDPQLKKQFINTNPKFGLDPDFWQGGEPIWNTAKKQGVNSAIHMWPGSEVPTVGNAGPLHVDKYNGTEPLPQKVDRIFSWLDTEDLQKRPELVLAYVPTIDQFGHKFGISGDELMGALRSVDDFVALVHHNLALRNLQDIVNVIVVSDHGMAPTSNDRLLFLDDLVGLDKLEHIDGWPLYGLRPKKEYSVDEIYEEMRRNFDMANSDTKDNFNLLRVEDFPPEYQFGGNISDHTFNYRLAPLWIVPNVGYSITTRAKFEESNNQYYPRGVHGYNNTHLLMRAVFLGQGPYFEKKLALSKKVLPFSNVNVYNIVCETLQLRPSANNGTLSGSDFAISSTNVIPKDWSDNLVYPDLPYPVEHIVRNATYDELWRVIAETDTGIDSSGISEQDALSDISSENHLMSTNLEPGSSTKTESVPFSHSSSVSTETEGGFFGHLLGGVGDFIDDVESAVEDAIEDAIDHAESWLEGDSEDGSR